MLLVSLRETNQNSLHLLEQKKIELNAAQSEIQALHHEQTSTLSKVRYQIIYLYLVERDAHLE